MANRDRGLRNVCGAVGQVVISNRAVRVAFFRR